MRLSVRGTPQPIGSSTGSTDIIVFRWGAMSGNKAMPVALAIATTALSCGSRRLVRHAVTTAAVTDMSKVKSVAIAGVAMSDSTVVKAS